MLWYHFVAGFFAGMFLSNFIPHYIKGVTGESFPTPFANPPGKGLSSPMTNAIWALANLVVGFLLFKFGKVSLSNELSLIPFFIGFVVITMVSVKNFSNEQKE
ncbi:MAG: hypothetical protein Q8928_07000 [Bacteroidota bacterium]|nr:hypothetical protein [Bacteroidota bacterium]